MTIQQIKLVFLLLFAVLACNSAFAEVFKPVNIYLPGNFKGQTLELGPDKQLEPADCYKLPALVHKLRKNAKTRSIDFYLDVGNNFSVNSLTSFCTDGLFADRILSECNCDARTVSAQDLMQFRNRILSQDIRKHILTNIEYPENYQIFEPFKSLNKSNMRLWLFNFISPSRLSKLPLFRWGQFKPENPARSLRRLAPNTGKKDITISIAHMNEKDCIEIKNQLSEFPGFHILVQVPESENDACFSTRIINRQNNVFFLSLPGKGTNRMPFIKIMRSNLGFPKMTINSMRFKKLSGKPGQVFGKKIKESVKKSLFETLALVPVTIRPSTAPFRFNPKLFADFARNQTKANFAIILAPEEKHKTDNIVDTASCLSSFKNERLYTGFVSGKQLVDLLYKLKINFTKLPELSGISVRFFAGQPESIKIGNRKVSVETNYSFCINETLLRHPLFFTDKFVNQIEPFSGITLWDLWKTQLKSLRLNKTHFMEL
jgi:hypothetical protein